MFVDSEDNAWNVDADEWEQDEEDTPAGTAAEQAGRWLDRALSAAVEDVAELTQILAEARAALDPELPEYADHLDICDALVARAGALADALTMPSPEEVTR